MTTTWQPGDPVHPHGGSPELYCACGTRIAGPTLNHGDPCPECGTPMTFDPTACLDRWRQLYDQAQADLTRTRTLATIRAVTLTLRQLSTWCIDGGGLEMTEPEFRNLADQVEALTVNDWWSCPMCQEVTCDGDCPLEYVREALTGLTVDTDSQLLTLIESSNPGPDQDRPAALPPSALSDRADEVGPA